MNTAFIPQHANNHNIAALMPQQHDQQRLEAFIEAAVQSRISSSLMYQVSCINCEEAGTLLSVDADTVRDWIKAGKLKASKVGREWIIRVVDIDRMLETNSSIIRMSDRRFKTNRRKIS